MDDGVVVRAKDWGPSRGTRPVICLPGLTRNARDFDALAEALAKEDRNGPALRVIAIDSRGRGRSDHADPSTYTLPQELKDVIAALDAWGIDDARFVGTSRGGLLIMLLAMVAPQRIDRAVLNDIGPRIEPVGLRRIAAGVGTTMVFASFDALAEELKARMALQFPRLGEGHWMRLAFQLASPAPEGGVRFDYDERLADLFRASADNDDGATYDFWPAFEALSSRPGLVIRGAHSDILSAATVEAMRRRDTRLKTFVASGEGHAPLLWDRRSLETVKTFLCGMPANLV